MLTSVHNYSLDSTLPWSPLLTTDLEYNVFIGDIMSSKCTNHTTNSKICTWYEVPCVCLVLILCSWNKASLELLWQNCDSRRIFFRWQLSFSLRQEVEVMNEVGEEEKQLNLGKSFSQTLSLADGEWNQMFIFLDIS